MSFIEFLESIARLADKFSLPEIGNLNINYHDYYLRKK